MKDKRILIVSSEVVPYLPENELSTTSFEAAKPGVCWALHHQKGSLKWA